MASKRQLAVALADRQGHANAADGDKKAEGDQVEAALGLVGRCQVDHARAAASLIEASAARTRSRDSPTASSARPQCYRRQTVRHMDLNLDGNGFDAAKGDGSDARRMA